MHGVPFTYDGYAGLIGLVRQMGYVPCPYPQSLTTPRACVLRHDVDFDLQQAARFSERETALCGVTADYFLLLRTAFYNVFSAESRRAISRILDGGHRIGLHFDETYYPACSPDALVGRIQDEARILSDAIGRPVVTVSMHRPSQAMLAADLTVPGVLNTYNDTFLHGFRYLSDSRMHWREDPVATVRSGAPARLHLLTHPFWYGQSERDTAEVLKRFVDRAAFDRYAAIKGNLRNLDEYMTMEEPVYAE